MDCVDIGGLHPPLPDGWIEMGQQVLGHRVAGHQRQPDHVGLAHPPGERVVWMQNIDMRGLRLLNLTMPLNEAASAASTPARSACSSAT